MNPEEENLVYFKDENGNKLTFEKLDELEYEGKTFIVLVEQGDNLPLIFQSCEDGSFDAVDDEDTVNAVFNLFQERAGDNFEFID